MAFRQVDPAQIARFNSAVSANLLSDYESHVISKLEDKRKDPSSKTFAPSQFACDRLSWFRLRGVVPDMMPRVDLQLNFTADIGTACHKIIQKNLVEMLEDSWIPVDEYLRDNPIDYDYKLTTRIDGLETFVTIENPPVKFACDGILKLDNIYYLLEIKTADHTSWTKLTEPKLHHVEQIKCYSSLLNISDVLFVYQDRVYGSFKIYQIRVSEFDKQAVKDKMKHVMRCVETNIAPEGLYNDPFWCASSVCPYFKKCKEYGHY